MTEPLNHATPEQIMQRKIGALGTLTKAYAECLDRVGTNPEATARATHLLSEVYKAAIDAIRPEPPT